MTPDPLERPAPAERRPAVWPWLLVPLVALAMFFALSRIRATTAPLETQPPPATESIEPAATD